MEAGQELTEGSVNPNDIRDDVNTLFSLLPEEGIASLFVGETCSLCKGEEKGKRESYGLFDMGHADPRARKKKLSLFRSKAYGFVVPLQFAQKRKISVGDKMASTRT